MKLEYEITGEAKGVDIYEVFSVELFLNDSSIGCLNMNGMEILRLLGVKS